MQYPPFRPIATRAGLSEHPVHRWLSERQKGRSGGVGVGMGACLVSRRGDMLQCWEDALAGAQATGAVEAALAQDVWPESVPTPARSCRIVSAADVSSMSVDARAAFLAHPTIITGVTGGWRARDEIKDAAAFAEHFGNHTVLARRTSLLERKMRQRGIDDHAMIGRMSVTVSEMVALNRHELVVLYDGEEGRSDAEDDLLDHVGHRRVTAMQRPCNGHATAM